MSTDAIVEFRYGDGSDLCAIYISHSMHLETFLPELRDIFLAIDRKEKHHRLNWDCMVSHVIAELVTRYHKVRILPPELRDPANVIYHVRIRPLPIPYAYKGNDIDHAIHATVACGIEERYDAYLYNCKNL